MEGPGVARYKSAARDLGAYVCFEDEAGQGLRPPKGRTWAPRGARPIVRVRCAGGGRVSITGVVCYRPGDRPHLFYQLRAYRRRKGEAKGFTWADYRLPGRDRPDARTLVTTCTTHSSWSALLAKAQPGDRVVVACGLEPHRYWIAGPQPAQVPVLPVISF